LPTSGQARRGLPNNTDDAPGPPLANSHPDHFAFYRHDPMRSAWRLAAEQPRLPYLSAYQRLGTSATAPNAPWVAPRHGEVKRPGVEPGRPFVFALCGRQFDRLARRPLSVHGCRTSPIPSPRSQRRSRRRPSLRPTCPRPRRYRRRPPRRPHPPRWRPAAWPLLRT